MILRPLDVSRQGELGVIGETVHPGSGPRTHAKPDPDQGFKPRPEPRKSGFSNNWM